MVTGESAIAREPSSDELEDNQQDRQRRGEQIRTDLSTSHGPAHNRTEESMYPRATKLE